MLKNKLEFADYHDLSDAECFARITRAREKLGEDLFILAHHYQREEVYQHADASGDSLGLSKIAAKTKAKYIVFCGVHFMAEVSAMLTSPSQQTILPDLAAGCSMADMANVPAVEKAWTELSAVHSDIENQITPITYINSTAALKAFCGRHGGIICTSTNAREVLSWALARREKVLFFPDEHLGRNTAYGLGIPLEKMVVWDFTKPRGGLTETQIQNAQIFLWRGFCSVHNKFKPEHIDTYLEKHPEAKVIAHPEACFEVCQKADYVGSTSYIIDTIANAPAETHWLVATELNLVNRLAAKYRDRGTIIKFMAPTVSMCSTMFRTDPQHLLWVLECLLEGTPTNVITVPENIQREALEALDAMYSVSL